jgi:hypothetical protein
VNAIRVFAGLRSRLAASNGKNHQRRRVANPALRVHLNPPTTHSYIAAVLVARSDIAAVTKRGFQPTQIDILLATTSQQ